MLARIHAPGLATCLRYLRFAISGRGTCLMHDGCMHELPASSTTCPRVPVKRDSIGKLCLFHPATGFNHLTEPAIAVNLLRLCMCVAIKGAGLSVHAYTGAKPLRFARHYFAGISPPGGSRLTVQNHDTLPGGNAAIIVMQCDCMQVRQEPFDPAGCTVFPGSESPDRRMGFELVIPRVSRYQRQSERISVGRCK